MIAKAAVEQEPWHDIVENERKQKYLKLRRCKAMLQQKVKVAKLTDLEPLIGKKSMSVRRLSHCF